MGDIYLGQTEEEGNSRVSWLNGLNLNGVLFVGLRGVLICKMVGSTRR